MSDTLPTMKAALDSFMPLDDLVLTEPLVAPAETSAQGVGSSDGRGARCGSASTAVPPATLSEST